MVFGVSAEDMSSVTLFHTKKKVFCNFNQLYTEKLEEYQLGSLNIKRRYHSQYKRGNKDLRKTKRKEEKETETYTETEKQKICLWEERRLSDSR